MLGSLLCEGNGQQIGNRGQDDKICLGEGLFREPAVQVENPEDFVAMDHGDAHDAPDAVKLNAFAFAEAGIGPGIETQDSSFLLHDLLNDRLTDAGAVSFSFGMTPMNQLRFQFSGGIAEKDISPFGLDHGKGDIHGIFQEIL